MSESEQIRKAVEECAGRGRRQRYSDELRDRIIKHTMSRRKAGADLVSIGAELHVPWRTLARWCAANRKAQRSFHPVEVVAKTAKTETITVHGPCGIRIEGLGMELVAELIRRLG
jgi:hypothetical protein